MNYRTPVTIDEALKTSFSDEGFMVVNGLAEPETIAGLRRACDAGVARIEASMRAAGEDHQGSSRLGERYIWPYDFAGDADLKRYAFGDAMARICRATLGTDAWFKAGYFAVKPAGGGEFPWHQDAAYADPLTHVPYVICWTALDYMTSENGALRVLPFSRAPTRALRPPPPGALDWQSYEGDDPGELLAASTGAVVAFTGASWHCSGLNYTAYPRRAAVLAFTAAPTDTGSLPFLRNGKPQPLRSGPETS